MRIKRNTVTPLLVAIVILYFGYSGVAGGGCATR